MKQAKIGYLKNHLSRYLDHVREGGEVLVLDRNRPIARIVPLGEAGAAHTNDERLRSLEQRGLVRRGGGGLPAWLGRRRPVRIAGSLLRDVLVEREEGW